MQLLNTDIRRTKRGTMSNDVDRATYAHTHTHEIKRMNRETNRAARLQFAAETNCERAWNRWIRSMNAVSDREKLMCSRNISFPFSARQLLSRSKKNTRCNEKKKTHQQQLQQ